MFRNLLRHTVFYAFAGLVFTTLMYRKQGLGGDLVWFLPALVGFLAGSLATAGHAAVQKFSRASCVAVRSMEADCGTVVESGSIGWLVVDGRTCAFVSKEGLRVSDVDRDFLVCL